MPARRIITMTENFSRFKRRFRIISAIVGAAVGICLGLLAVGAVLFGLRLAGIELHWAIYLAIGLGVAALTGTGAFFVAMPSDRKIAKKLDRDFALGEKVQTMVEFSAVEEPSKMVLLQREQTDEVLGEVAKRRINVKGLLKFAFIPVLAAAMFAGGMLTPLAKNSDGGEVDPPYDITATQKTALLSLIKDVEGSALGDTVKTPTLEVLNGLVEKLEVTTTQSVMKDAVISAVKLIDGLVAAENDYLSVYTAMAGDELLKPLATATVDGVAFYKTGGTDLQTMDAVNVRYKEAPQKIYDFIYGWSQDFTAQFEEMTTISQVTPVLSNFSQTMYAKLIVENKAPEIGQSVLYDTYRTFISGFTNLSGGAAGLSLELFLVEVNEVIDTMVDGVTDELVVQSYNCMMDDYVRNSLARIFGLSRTDIGSNETVIPDVGGDEEGEEGPSHGGGFGDGDINYGSDDLILDPDTLEKVPYGELINRYNAAIQERINAGDTPEELAKYIRKYFDALYGGIKEDE